MREYFSKWMSFGNTLYYNPSGIIIAPINKSNGANVDLNYIYLDQNGCSQHSIFHRRRQPRFYR
jgi:hypothetical protein